MTPFSSLSRTKRWNRKPPRPDSPKRELYEKRIEGQRAKKARDKALTEGCEYRVFLRGWYRLNGCAACGKWNPTGPHLHHTAHRSQKGRAETQVPICPPCHTEDGRGIEAKALQDYGADLFLEADKLATAGLEQGYLPVEMCEADGCGAWHSRRFMIDDIDQRTGVARRICEACAPEGPR
jgi:hypothetical protein